MRGVPKPERDKAVAQVAELLQIEPPARPQAGPALRRPAPARRDGPRAGAQPASLPVRRAALQPRRQAARRHAHRDQAAAPAAQDHDRLRHPRPDRGDDARDPDRRDARTAICSSSARRRRSTTTRPTVRRGLHRLAGDEPVPGEARSKTASRRRGSGRRPGEATLPFAEGRGLRRHAGREVSSACGPRRSPTATAPTATAQAVHVVEAPVEVTEPAGSDTFVVTHLGGKEVTGRLPRRRRRTAGPGLPLRDQHGEGGGLRPQDRAADRVMSDGPDIVIIGSGIGGATAAAALAPSGRRIVILERGERLADSPGGARRCGRSSPVATSARRRSGTDAGPARLSTRATTTTSAATPSSTAPC